MDYKYEAAVNQLRRRLVQDDGRDVQVRQLRPLNLFIGTATREGHEMDTRKVSTPPKANRFIG
jgi:hypothetical protein